MQKFRVLSSKKQRKADKTVRLLFPEPAYERMLSAFDGAESAAREGYAVAQCGYKVDGARKHWSYLVRSLHVPLKEELFEQSSITVTPQAEFLESILGEAAEKGNVILELHTHVGSPAPNFSWLDIGNGLENGRFLKSCGLRFAMAVIGRAGFSFCEYDADHDAIQMPESARISVMGRLGLKDALVHRSTSSCDIRSKRGPEGMLVAIGGLDGVGFGVLYELARQGVKNFLLLDDGVIDESSAGALPYKLEAGKKRTKAAQGMLKKLFGEVNVTRVSAADRNVMGELKECDVIFSCGAGEALGAALNEASLRYYIPLIEARTLATGAGICGRVRVLMPSITGCSGCFGDDGLCAAGPSGVLWNAVALLAVQELMGIIRGGEASSTAYDCIEYDYGTQSIRKKYTGRDAACTLCGINGILGAGDVRKPKRT